MVGHLSHQDMLTSSSIQTGLEDAGVELFSTDTTFD
jgi:hypothetical protein